MSMINRGSMDEQDESFVYVPVEDFQAILNHLTEICLYLQQAINAVVPDGPEEERVVPILRIIKKPDPEQGH